MGEEDVTNAVLAERIKAIKERLDKMESMMADKETVAAIKKAIFFVQMGVFGAVITSLMKLLGLG